MKKLNLMVLTLVALMISSCSTKVDLYSNKGDNTVVYMMLDTGADTNFVKITKSFVGDATTLAQNYDACNYKYNELDVTLVREKNSAAIQLDTISKWVPYDPNTPFYSGCYQTYYYTDVNLREGENYKLVIKRNDGVEVTASTQTIENFVINMPIENYQINFETETNFVRWINKGQSGNLESNAAFFEAVAYFRYKEVMPGSTDTAYREIRWGLGSGTAANLYVPKKSYYNITYSPKSIISILANDKYLKENSPEGACPQRFIQKMRFEVTGIGADYYNYLIINNSSSAIQDTPEFTNINNGIGLMSSRVTHTQPVVPNDVSRRKITDEFPQYNFIYEPNAPTN